MRLSGKPGKVKPVAAVFLVLLLTAMIFIAAGCGPKTAESVNQGTAKANQNPGSSSALTGSVPTGIGPDTIADIVSRVSPAVVKIDTVTQTGGGSDPFFNDPFFRQFFGTPFGIAPQVEEGLGSGFLISADGYILTNQHVVEGAREIKVTVSGYDTPFKAKVTGSDYDLDLAVLKIEGSKAFSHLELGDSDQVRVGEWAIAIGNPYGLDHTVTIGLISAKGRPVSIGDRNYENLLQTDASINPGNSGGPLLNLRGQVIGINTAINSQAQGIGFAIPTSTVQGVLKTLLSSGQVSRPWIGVSISDVTPQVAEYLGLSKAEGAVVLSVEANGPAAKAGIRRGDVVMNLGGKNITKANDLVKAIQGCTVGQSVPVTVLRQGKTLNLTVTMVQKPAR